MRSDAAAALVAAVFVMAAAGIGTFFGWHLHAWRLRAQGRELVEEAEELARREGVGR